MASIVVGVDGSDEARRALDWAVAEARLRGAALRVVHAYQSQPDAAGTERLRREADLIVQAAVTACETDGLDVDARAVSGSAPSALLEASRGADLLVVGSRGRHGFPGLLLGSVSQQLAHHARCPVVIVPPERPAQ